MVQQVCALVLKGMSVLFWLMHFKQIVSMIKLGYLFTNYNNSPTLWLSLYRHHSIPPRLSSGNCIHSLTALWAIGIWITWWLAQDRNVIRIELAFDTVLAYLQYTLEEGLMLHTPAVNGGSFLTM